MLHQSVVGRMSVGSPFDFDHEPRFADDARGYESGIENAVGIAGLGAAIDLVLTAGRERIEQQVLGAADELAAELSGGGWHVLRRTDPERRSGIVIASTGGADPATHQRPLAAGVRCALRGGIRFSPHYFTNADDLAAVAAIVAS